MVSSPPVASRRLILNNLETGERAQGEACPACPTAAAGNMLSALVQHDDIDLRSALGAGVVGGAELFYRNSLKKATTPVISQTLTTHSV